MSKVRARVALTLLLLTAVGTLPPVTAEEADRCVRVDANQNPGSLRPMLEVGSAIVLGASGPAGVYALVVTLDRCLPTSGPTDGSGNVVTLRDAGVGTQISPLP